MSIDVSRIEEAVSRLASLAVRNRNPADEDLARDAEEEVAKVRRLVDALKETISNEGYAR